MVDFKNLIAVGATSRNLGKTEFISRLINRFRSYSIVALKIKTVYPGDQSHHGKGTEFEGNYLIRKENEADGLDDSKRFLAAGAKSVFYIKSQIQYLDQAIQEVRSLYPNQQLFIAESNSILKYFSPGVFIMIKGQDETKYKPSSLAFMHLADKIIYSDGLKFDCPPEEIDIQHNNQGWEK